MRQLDLFSSLFDPPAQQDVVEKQTAVSKEAEKVAAKMPKVNGHSKNGVENIEAAAQKPVTDSKVCEQAEVPATVKEELISTAQPLLSLFDEALSRHTIKQQHVETVIMGESEWGIKAVDSNAQTENEAFETVANQPELLVAEEQTESFLTSKTEAALPAKRNPTTAKTRKQKLPQLEPAGSIIFDDGKIAVKIKNKSPFPAPAVKVKREKVKKEPQKRGRKSFKEIDAEIDLIEIPEDEVLFQKQYYAISEVAKWFRVNTSLLRFWENEFDVLKPRKNRKGDRLFRPEDVKNLQLIYQLLRQRKYTIEGAREYIKANKKKADMQLQLTNSLQKFKTFLLDLKANLQ